MHQCQKGVFCLVEWSVEVGVSQTTWIDIKGERNASGTGINWSWPLRQICFVDIVINAKNVTTLGMNAFE